MDSLTFLYIGYFISIGLYVATILLEASLVIPLQFKEAGVKNGLKVLREQLLMKGVVSLVVALTSVMALTSRYFLDGEINRYVIVIAIVVNALGIFAKAFLDYRIYHQEYTEVNKQFHARVAEMEAKEKKNKKK